MPDDPTIADEQPRSHRAGAWVVLILGIAGLGLGIFQWRGSFGAVFAHTGSPFKTPSQAEAERIAALKTKDTDTDGLTDYDETYVYKTSPYLQDSDSDGKSDKAEVESGGDPNCPKESCGAKLGSTPSSADSASSTAARLEAEAAAQLANPTPAQIRAMLIESGAKAEDLAGIDDATLLELYHQSLVEVQNGQTNTSP